MHIDLLLIEDEAPKQERIMAFLSENWPDAKIRTARSVRSAIREICDHSPTLNLLDMSLPTFDVSPTEPGGRPQNFGGIEVLRYMDLYQIVVPTIVVTAYEAFSKDGRPINHGSLDEELRREHPSSYQGLIYYNSLFTEWRTILSGLIQAQLSKDEGK